VATHLGDASRQQALAVAQEGNGRPVVYSDLAATGEPEMIQRLRLSTALATGRKRVPMLSPCTRRSMTSERSPRR